MRTISGNTNNGTAHGATLATDRFGMANNAYYFDGSSAYITAPLNGSVFQGDFTASLWFNAYDFAGESPDILHEQTGSFNWGLLAKRPAPRFASLIGHMVAQVNLRACRSGNAGIQF